MSVQSPEFWIVRIFFSLAFLVLSTRIGIWLLSVNLAITWRIVVSFLIFGSIGVLWIESLQWIGKHEKIAAMQAYTGRLHAGRKILLSAKENIFPELKLGTSEAIFRKIGDPSLPFLKLAGDNYIKIELEDEQIKLSIKIRDKSGKMIAEIIDNEWSVAPKPSTWDRNFNRNSLEVKDPSGDRVLQVILIGNRVQLQAKLYDSDGKGIGLAGRKIWEGGMIEQTSPDHPELVCEIEPIFKYPSELHFGELIKEE